MEIHKEYPCHSTNFSKGRTGGILYLVIHYVGAEGHALDNAKYFGSTPSIQASAHYFVGHACEDAAVYASVPEEDTAWHVGAKTYVHPHCRNDNAIGIEMCCHRDSTGRWYFDPATVDQTVALAREIMARRHIPPDRVLRHYDVTGKNCPVPYVKDPTAWAAFKARLT